MPVTHFLLLGGDDSDDEDADDERGGLTAACLEVLQGFPLGTLFLGQLDWLTNAGLNKLRRLPLTSLELCFCTEGNGMSDRALEALTDMPLTKLTLFGIKWLTDSGLAALRNLKLTALSLRLNEGLSDQGLRHLANMPLTSLDLGDSPWLTDGGLLILESFRLQGMKLARLNVAGCEGLSDGGRAGVADLQEAWSKENLTSVSELSSRPVT